MLPTMTLKFWGVRGSIPSPNPSMIRYGGNTACISISFGAEKILILDAGTGIRELGKQLAGSNEEIFLLLSHCHWDHIQGFPFFLPIYEKKRRLHISSTEKEKNIIYSLIDQMDGAHFPVESGDLPSLSICTSENATDYLKRFGFYVSWIKTNHPGDGYGYLIKDHNRSIVYLTDNELDPPYKRNTGFNEFAEFCRHADILIHDAQYLEKDMPEKLGWGHSLVSQAMDLGAAAAVKHLILTHHDPDRTDDELDKIQSAANQWFKKRNNAIKCTVAYEGLTISL